MIKYEEFFNNLKCSTLVIFGTAFLLFISLVFYLGWRGRREAFDYEFNGVVTDITYDIKDDPTVVINRKQFLIAQIFWQTNHQIEKGDSLSKQTHSMRIVLVKHISHEVFLFDIK